MSQRPLYQINSNRKLQSSKNLDEIFINTLTDNKNDIQNSKVIQSSTTSTYMKEHLNRLNALQKNVLNYILHIGNQLVTFQDKNLLNDSSVKKNPLQNQKQQNEFQQQKRKTGKFEKPSKIFSNLSKHTQSKQIIALIETSQSLNQQCQKMFKTLLFVQSSEKDKHKKELLFQHELILVKGYCYILVLNLSFISTLSLPQVLSNSQVQLLLQNLFKVLSFRKQDAQKSVHLLKLCLKQLFNFQTLISFIQYDLNTNQQYKYDENTQIQFLFQMGIVKLSESFGYFMLDTLQYQHALAIKQIYQQGKQSIQRCRSLLIRKSVNKSEIYDSNIQSFNNIQKNSLIFNKIQEIQQFFNWLEQNWINKIINIIKSNVKTRPQLSQMPLIHVSNYHLFVMMYKFRQYEKSMMKQKNSIISNGNVNKQNFIREHKIVEIRQRVLKQVLIIKKNFISNKSITQNNDMEKSFIAVYQVLIQKFNSFLKTQDFSIESIKNLIQNQSFKYLIQKINNKEIEKINNKDNSIKYINNIFDSNKSENSSSISEKKQKSTKLKVQNQFLSGVIQKEQQLITPIKQQKLKKKVQQKQFSKVKSQIQIILDKKILTICQMGQYLTKFNYNNDSFSTKYVKLSTSNDRFLWGQSKQQVNDGNSSQIKMSKVVGLVYGDVTKRIIYHTEKNKGKSNKIQPHRCFSLITKDRTLDFYCHINQYDIYFWLSGLSHYLRTIQKREVNFNRGKILWKKCLLKLKYLYSVKPDPKKSRFYFGRDNARAIINFGKNFNVMPKK